MPFSIPTHPASGGGTGTVGRVLLGAGTHPFGHHAGLVAGVMSSVHLCVCVEHADPSRIVPANATEIRHTPPHDVTRTLSRVRTHVCTCINHLPDCSVAMQQLPLPLPQRSHARDPRL
eukprot:SAG11_NODE_13836_length_637_cov_1.052045_1_plen_118_part_00